MQGKWAQPGVPHRGWSCVGVDDFGSPDVVCEMCETQEIRYVHTMRHPDYPHELGVGCVCAEHMEEDYERPRRRERNLINAARRRGKWLTRGWRTSARGNSFLNTDGFNITVFRNHDGTWGGKIEYRNSGQSIKSRRLYRTEDQAKLASFDAMIFLKNERGWGASG